MALHTDIERAADALGISEDIQALREAAQHSDRTLMNARDFLAEAVPHTEHQIDVVVLGSYARGEATPESDFDYLVIPHALPKPASVRTTRDLLGAVDEFIERLSRYPAGEASSKTHKPGESGLFGRIQSAPDLVERIGLEQDTNVTHTRRSLLLQESVSVFNDELHAELLRTVLTRYLIDYEAPKPGPPRFLINDLTRYWYTVTVDYQAKRWERLERGWALRYLKLLVSRRLSYVATVLPALLCSEAQPAEVDRLVTAYRKPPLARLAELLKHPEFSEQDALRSVFRLASEFISTVSNAEARVELERLGPRPNRGESPMFDSMKELIAELDAALRAILFGSLLRPRSERYLTL